MPNDSRILYRRFQLGALGLTIFAALTRVLSLCFFFDPSVGYVDAGIIPTLLYIARALFPVWCALYAFAALRLEKKTLIAVAPNEEAATPALRYASFFCAVALIVSMVAELSMCGFSGKAALLRYLSAIVAAFYFIPRSRRSITAGLGVVAYTICAVAGEYFDWTVTLNSPIKLMGQAALMSAALFILAELCHVNHTRRSVRYTVCAALSMFCGFTNGLSLGVAALVGGIVKPTYLLHALPPLAIGLYAALRLFAGHEIILPEPALEADEEATAESEQTTESPAPPTQPTQEEENNG